MKKVNLINFCDKKIYLCFFVLVCISFFIVCNNNIICESHSNENNKKYVYIGGNIVGIKANTDGVLVVGYEEKDVEYIGGIKIGDNVLKLDGQRINNSEEIVDILNKAKKHKVSVEFERDKILRKTEVNTKYENGKYRLGLWVRDKISGIGTMTCYDPTDNTVAAIGHEIRDYDTNKILKISSGDIYNTNSVKVIKSRKNNIGYLSSICNNDSKIATFYNNKSSGISGKSVNKEFVLDKKLKLTEVDFYNVKRGNALVVFEDENKKIKSYKIKIKDIKTNRGNHKEIRFEILDKELLNYTGGIVQGMSGAPIIQNNKLIGAVTHVSKINPKKGYGILISDILKSHK